MEALRKACAFLAELLQVVQQISLVVAAVGDGQPINPAAAAALRGPGAMAVKVCGEAETINKPTELLMVAVAAVPVLVVVVAVAVAWAMQVDIALEEPRILNHIGPVLPVGRALMVSLGILEEPQTLIPEVLGAHPEVVVVVALLLVGPVVLVAYGLNIGKRKELTWHS
jgi:hypothetical protein